MIPWDWFLNTPSLTLVPTPFCRRRRRWASKGQWSTTEMTRQCTWRQSQTGSPSSSRPSSRTRRTSSSARCSCGSSRRGAKPPPQHPQSFLTTRNPQRTWRLGKLCELSPRPFWVIMSTTSWGQLKMFAVPQILKDTSRRVSIIESHLSLSPVNRCKNWRRSRLHYLCPLPPTHQGFFYCNFSKEFAIIWILLQADTRDNTIDLIHLFRDYLHYHLKCSKAYIHSR